MTRSAALPELEQQRARLRDELAAVGDFRPGSLSQAMRRCGKANCACADAEPPGPRPTARADQEGRRQDGDGAPAARSRAGQGTRRDR